MVNIVLFSVNQTADILYVSDKKEKDFIYSLRGNIVGYNFNR